MTVNRKLSLNLDKVNYVITGRGYNDCEVFLSTFTNEENAKERLKTLQTANPNGKYYITIMTVQKERL